METIRFRPTEYTSDFQPNGQHNRVLEGRILRENPDGSMVVQVGSMKLPYYVRPEDVVEGGEIEC